MSAAQPYAIGGEHFGSMNDRTTDISIELRYLKVRHGHLITWAECLPRRETLLALQHAARFLGLPSWRHGVAHGWILDMQSTAIAMIEGPS